MPTANNTGPDQHNKVTQINPVMMENTDEDVSDNAALVNAAGEITKSNTVKYRQ